MASACNSLGTLAQEESGTNGWPIDQIFIPDGYEKTLAAMTDAERLAVWKRNAWYEIADYLHEYHDKNHPLTNQEKS